MAEKTESEIEASEESEQETALLPRSWFQGKDLEIGSKCELKIEGLYDDEVEVSYVPHKKNKDGKDSDDEDEADDHDSMDGAMKRMDSMAEPMAGPPPMGAY